MTGIGSIDGPAASGFTNEHSLGYSNNLPSKANNPAPKPVAELALTNNTQASSVGASQPVVTLLPTSSQDHAAQVMLYLPAPMQANGLRLARKSVMVKRARRKTSIAYLYQQGWRKKMADMQAAGDSAQARVSAKSWRYGYKKITRALPKAFKRRALYKSAQQFKLAAPYTPAALHTVTDTLKVILQEQSLKRQLALAQIQESQNQQLPATSFIKRSPKLPVDKSLINKRSTQNNKPQLWQNSWHNNQQARQALVQIEKNNSPTPTIDRSI